MRSNCNRNCQLCKNLVFSQAVTFADGTLTINLPAGSYDAGDHVCIVLTQAIPAETTIVAPVVITVGTGTAQYPLTNRCCAQLTACALRTRRIYPATVITTPTGGSFRLNGDGACAPVYNLPALDGTATAAPAEGGGNA